MHIPKWLDGTGAGLLAISVVATLLAATACSGGAGSTGGAPPVPTTAAKTETKSDTKTPEIKAPAAASTTAPSPATAAKSAASPAPGGQTGTQYAITGPLASEAKQLNGAGATFPAPLYSKWFEEYNKLTQVRVNYQSIGSGGGKKAVLDKTADFGASDSPMSDDEQKQAGGNVLHIPTAVGAVVPTYNLPNVSKPVRFTPDTLSGIYLGTIKKWNDPKIAADNPGVSFPNEDIITVQRSDGSGTTDIFTRYLAAVSPDFKSKVGAGTAVNWPGGIGAKGNEGVAGEVKQNPYAIGYVELIYALQNKLPVGWMKNKAGSFVEPTLETTTAAAAGVATTIAPDLRASIVDADGPASWPIAGFTWLLVYDKIEDKAKAEATTRMLWWAIHDAQKYNNDLGYATVPAPIVQKAEEKILAITSGGQPALPRG